MTAVPGHRLPGAPRGALGVLLVAALGGCEGWAPTGLPDPTRLLAAGGEDQTAPPLAPLPFPLRVSVRSLGNDAPAQGVAVSWEVVEGSGARLTHSVTVTGEDGVAENGLVLGALPGLYRVRVSAPGADPLEFRARAVEPAVVTGIEPERSPPGGVVRVRGSRFRPDPADNLVLFGGVRGRVLTATDSLLDVQVPECLPPREVALAVSVGSVTSLSPVPLLVEEGGPGAAALPPGGDLSVEVRDGSECVRLAGGATYVVLAQSTGTVGGGLYDFSLLGLGEGAGSVSTAGPAGGARALPAFPLAWKAALRGLEEALGTRTRFSPGAPTPRPAPAAVEVGEERRFRVLAAGGGFQEVRAAARWVGERAVFFEDLEMPGAFSAAELRALAEEFDDPVFPVVTGAFGAPSDIDRNGRVIVLFTPVVNRITPPGSRGFVAGFFFGLDLLPSLENSNAAEIFYALVPDPGGRFGDPRERQDVLRVLPPILAHEFQHMVHFNQRMLVLQASRQESLWLSEALAQAAESLVGDTLRERGDAAAADKYLEPNLRRAREFLGEPQAVSLVVSVGQGTLAERGAGWLFLRYLMGQYGGTGLLGAMTRTTLTGRENIEAVSGRAWSPLYSDWAVSLHTDGLAQVEGPRFHYPDLDLRGTLTPPGGAYPLVPGQVGGDFERRGSRLSASTEYFILPVPAPGSATLRLSAGSGGAPSPEARFRLRVVRIE